MGKMVHYRARLLEPRYLKQLTSKILNLEPLTDGIEIWYILFDK